MSIPHRHAPDSFQRRLVKEFVRDNAYVDRERSESVCRLTHGELLEVLSFEVGDATDPSAVHEELGEVLKDSLGRGSYQMEVNDLRLKNQS